MIPSIRERMQADLVAALKGGDLIAVSVLRTTLAALSNAEATGLGVDAPLVRAGLFRDVERRRLTGEDVAAIVDHERRELESAAAVLDAAGKTSEAAGRRARAAILDSYLAA